MAGQIYLPPAGAAKPEIRHTAYRYPLWRSHAFAHSQRQRLSGRQLRHYAQDCRMAAGMGQTTRLQYQLHMETAKQPVARPASLAVGDTHQIQNQLCRRRARRCAWFDNNWDGDYIGWLYGGTGTRPRAQDGLPNTNGRFNTRQGQALYAANNRNGLTVSNKMKLNDKLQLTLSATTKPKNCAAATNLPTSFSVTTPTIPKTSSPTCFSTKSPTRATAGGASSTLPSISALNRARGSP